MHGAVDDVEVLVTLDDVGVDAGFAHGHHVVIVHFATDEFHEVFVLLELHVFDGHLVHLVDDALVVGREHLCAVAPVGLVAVVLLGIVAGRDVDAGHGTELTYGETDLGCRAQSFKEEGADAVGREDCGHGLGKEAAVVAAVVTHDDAELAAPAAGIGFQDVVGKSLRGHADDVLVHAVGARAHDAAKASRAEFKAAVEALNELSLVGVFHHAADGLLRLLVIEG